jgi:hypothetical protein
MHLHTVQSLMRTFRRHKLVHVAAWETDTLGRVNKPVFAFGAGADKPRKSLTGAQRQERYRERVQHQMLGATI